MRLLVKSILAVVLSAGFTGPAVPVKTVLGQEKTVAKPTATPLRTKAKKEQIKVSESGTNNTTRSPEKLSPSISWGLGWGLQTTADGVSFWHRGDNEDSKSYIIAFERQKLGVLIFANSVTGLSIAREIVDLAVGGDQPALAWLKYETYKYGKRRSGTGDQEL